MIMDLQIRMTVIAGCVRDFGRGLSHANYHDIILLEDSMEKIEVDIAKLKSLYESGLTIIECGIKMNVGRSVIWKRLHENNIELRPQYRWEKGAVKTEEHKRKIVIGLTGIKRSDETKEKLRKANTGKKLTEEHKQKISEYMKGRYIGKKNPLWQGGVSLKYNPVREKAHNTIRYLKRAGRLINQPCEICGKLRADAHHDDYTKPKEIRWLCPKHHRDFHMAHKLENNKYVKKEY